MKIIPFINKALERIETKRPKKRSYFYISEAGKSPFEIYKSMHRNYKISPRLKRIFDNGKCVHKRIAGYLEKQDVVKAKEVRINNKLFHGRADAIVFLDGRVAVLEIKSMNKKCFYNLKKYCSRPAYLQLQLYMHFMKIDDGIILVECKDSQRLKEFYIRRKPRVAKEIIRDFSKLKKKYVKSGVMAT
tara:strand:- start:195 stop:758 length:564 start_codon:yes stop_codon:yes gene_type:complete